MSIPLVKDTERSSYIQDHLAELERRALAHRFLYYVMGKPVVPDATYDALEREILPFVAADSMLRKPGSDRIDDYPMDVIVFARWLQKPIGLPPYYVPIKSST